jgi:hypothetical protein
MNEAVEVECVHCGKSVNAPDGEVRVNKSNRPGSFWIDTKDGTRKVLCFPCSWDREVLKKYPRLKYEKKRFSKTVVALSAHPAVIRQEKQEVKNSGSGLLVFLSVFAVTVLIVIASMNSQDTYSPNDGYDAEWEADNSIDGPPGTFDDQSKP